MKRFLLSAVAITAAVMPCRANVSAEDANAAFANFVRLARQWVNRPAGVTMPDAPVALPELSYDQYREIRYRADMALWRDESLPFQIQFFHPGGLFPHPVCFTQLTPEGAQKIGYSRELFSFGTGVESLDTSAVSGFAGFRIHCALNRADYLDELGAFLGASYFRLLGSDQRYGLSARGIALHCGEDQPETFPRFTRFLAVQPDRGAGKMQLFALLQGENVGGAYRFTLMPGADTVAEVEARLFIRDNEPIDSVGLAPLTSMFWFGENSGHPTTDFRPEVHDSDGLLVDSTEGGRIWRPLRNPTGLCRSDFPTGSLRGFGLMQRDRSFASYEDLEACYQMRPSVWIEPMGDWGKGNVRLVEIPTKGETADNIVAMWVPGAFPENGEINLHYRMHWFREDRLDPTASALLRVRSTRIGTSMTDPAGWLRVVVDFNGTEDGDVPQAVILRKEGAVLHRVDVLKNEAAGGWRAVLTLSPESGPVSLSFKLETAGRAISEIWDYIWTP